MLAVRRGGEDHSVVGPSDTVLRTMREGRYCGTESIWGDAVLK